MYQVSFTRKGEKRARVIFIDAKNWQEAGEAADLFCQRESATLGAITKVDVYKAADLRTAKQS